MTSIKIKPYIGKEALTLAQVTSFNSKNGATNKETEIFDLRLSTNKLSKNGSQNPRMIMNNVKKVNDNRSYEDH